MNIEVYVESELPCSPAQLWAAVGTMSGVNYELGPWIRMSTPEAFRGVHIDAWADRVEKGKPIFRSWVLLLGVVPIDRHSFGMDRIEPGRSFSENSTSWTMKEWRHDRKVESISGGGCRVQDRVRATPRLPGVAVFVRPIYKALFRHRHKRLRRKFGPNS